MDIDIPDLSDIVGEEFSFRRKARAKPAVKDEHLAADLGNDTLPYVPPDILDQTEDNDYAPKPRGGQRKRRAPRPRKKKAEVSEQVSDEDPEPSTDVQAYFDGTAPATDEDGNEVYCICRRGDLGKWMIGCDGCDEWYHGSCVNVSVHDEELVDKFFCPRCQRNGEGTTMWKRKCRLKSCRKPALDAAKSVDEDTIMAGTDSVKHSKYCSHEHGVEYLRDKISEALISKAQIKSLLLATGTLRAFHAIGDVAPVAEGSLLPAESLRLESMARERDTINAALKNIDDRINCLNRMQERAMRINADLKARKEKEICGLDERLNLQDRDLDTLIQSDGFLQSLLNSSTDKLCTVVAKKCTRHAGWHQIKLDGMALEQDNLRRDMNRLRMEDKELRLAAQRRMAS